MGRPTDLKTLAEYRVYKTYPDYKNGAAVCRHCDRPEYPNNSRMKLHLTECLLYQQYSSAQTAERLAKKRRLQSGQEQPTQATISDIMTPARHSRADELAALMIYQAGLPFGFFEKPKVIAFLRALNSAYTPPKRNVLATTMLDKT
jgi:hypothetical protein